MKKANNDLINITETQNQSVLERRRNRGKYERPSFQIINFEQENISGTKNNYEFSSHLSDSDTSISRLENDNTDLDTEKIVQSHSQNLQRESFGNPVENLTDGSRSGGVSAVLQIKNQIPEEIQSLIINLERIDKLAKKLKERGKSDDEIAGALTEEGFEIAEHYARIYVYLKDVLKLGKEFFYKMDRLVGLLEAGKHFKNLDASTGSVGSNTLKMENAENTVCNALKVHDDRILDDNTPRDGSKSGTEKSAKNRHSKTGSPRTKKGGISTSKKNKENSPLASKISKEKSTIIGGKKAEQTSVAQCHPSEIKPLREEQKQEIPVISSVQYGGLSTKELLDLYNSYGVDTSIEKIVFKKKELKPEIKEKMGVFNPEKLFSYINNRKLCMLIETEIYPPSVVAERYGVNKDSLVNNNSAVRRELLDLLVNAININSLRNEGFSVQQIAKKLNIFSVSDVIYYQSVYKHIFENGVKPKIETEDVVKITSVVTKEDFRLAQQAINKPKDVVVPSECTRAMNKVYEAHYGLVRLMNQRVFGNLSSGQREEIENAILDGYSFAIETFDYESYDKFSTYAIRWMQIKMGAILRQIYSNMGTSEPLLRADTLWLDKPINDQQADNKYKTTYSEFFSDGSYEEMKDDIERRDDIEYTKRLLMYLNPQQQEVLLRKYRGETFESIGRSRGITRQAIELQHRLAMDKIRTLIRRTSTVGCLIEQGKTFEEVFSEVGQELGLKNVEKVKLAYRQFVHINKGGASPCVKAKQCTTPASVNTVHTQTKALKTSYSTENSVATKSKTSELSVWSVSHQDNKVYFESKIEEFKKSGYLISDDFRTKMSILNILDGIELLVDGKINLDFEISELYAGLSVFNSLSTTSKESRTHINKLFNAISEGKTLGEVVEMVRQAKPNNKNKKSHVIMQLNFTVFTNNFIKIIKKSSLIHQKNEISAKSQSEMEMLSLLDGFYLKFVDGATNTLLEPNSKENKMIKIIDLLYGKYDEIDFELVKKLANCDIQNFFNAIGSGLPYEYYDFAKKIYYRTPEFYEEKAGGLNYFAHKMYFTQTKIKKFLELIINEHNNSGTNTQLLNYYSIIFEDESQNLK